MIGLLVTCFRLVVGWVVFISSDIFTCTVCYILGDPGNAGTIPGTIGNLVKMTTLDLTGTGKMTYTPPRTVTFVGGLSGVLPPAIGQLTKLTTFHIEGCSLSGTFALIRSWPPYSIDDINIFVS